ncbi:hypothetical protein BDV95DRAFT_177374 [Massariosphaeria phaeospora]|uniref:Uncharacterized protein n=1 Tax=Massariosphaeria phaeospora TaxID=100035 RepID=A0A7C8M6N7_9PLEO|nr:hypothetical protein BDV95DRAFT_177374 [Massariosphaeria phaeospora]
MGHNLRRHRPSLFLPLGLSSSEANWLVYFAYQVWSYLSTLSTTSILWCAAVVGICIAIPVRYCKTLLYLFVAVTQLFLAVAYRIPSQEGRQEQETTINHSLDSLDPAHDVQYIRSPGELRNSHLPLALTLTTVLCRTSIYNLYPPFIYNLYPPSIYNFYPPRNYIYPRP